MTTKQAARAMAKRRWKVNPATTNGGRPRSIKHDPDSLRCRCVDCRRARNESPYKTEPALAVA